MQCRGSDLPVLFAPALLPLSHRLLKLQRAGGEEGSDSGKTRTSKGLGGSLDDGSPAGRAWVNQRMKEVQYRHTLHTQPVTNYYDSSQGSKSVEGFSEDCRRWMYFLQGKTRFPQAGSKRPREHCHGFEAQEQRRREDVTLIQGRSGHAG